MQVKLPPCLKRTLQLNKGNASLKLCETGAWKALSELLRAEVDGKKYVRNLLFH